MLRRLDGELEADAMPWLKSKVQLLVKYLQVRGEWSVEDESGAGGPQHASGS